MATDATRRVTVDRLRAGVYRATTSRGDELTFGSAEGAGFTPVELLLAAIAGCSAVDVDTVTTRHAEPERFDIEVTGDKVRDEAGGNIMRDLTMTYRVGFPAGESGDHARELLPRAVRSSRERACTVSRTVEAGVPVEVVIDDPT